MNEALLLRIAEALERLAPAAPLLPDLSVADGFIWQARQARLLPVPRVACVALALLKGLDPQKAQLLENTRRFAQGLPANNALLWGARGMGKSALVKAVHAALTAEFPGALVLVEIHREEIGSLPTLLNLVRAVPQRIVILCDDLSFEPGEGDYKALKSVLDGGIEGRPSNVLFYATSNRRHLMPREMMENERSTAITPGEAVEEAVSLSDRFGLWLGFHSGSQDQFFEMVEGYAAAYQLPLGQAELRAEAAEWAVTRGSRSGRVAWQFIQDLAGRLGVRLT